jgi:hypothetical protein
MIDPKKEKIIQKIIFLKTFSENGFNTKRTIQKLQQELDKIENERPNAKNI